MIRSSQVILDISGGDSFTDMYGPARFAAITAPKLIAVENQKPLVLLPQTYGPFRDASCRKIAARLVGAARCCWARDPRSFAVLAELLGNSFDPKRHRCGVDVAFLLPRGRAARLSSDAASPVGVNVSGLIWNSPTAGREFYSFKADYREAVTRTVAGIAASVPVLLVPHVVTPRGHYESDRDACESLLAQLPAAVRGNVRISPDLANSCDAKGLISQCSWFLGTRMHSTIAALSSGVPTGAISYSDKTLGVFETCGQGEHVHDPRHLGTDELVERVMRSFERREGARASLATHLPGVLAKANEQMDELARDIHELAHDVSVSATRSKSE